MSIAHVKRVTFLCPAVTTGGPEAIHQASQLLNQQGVPSDIAYYGGADGGIDVDGGRVRVQPPSVNPCLAGYARYEPQVCREALLRRQNLIVLPEPLAPMSAGFKPATVAVWWLSVDNGVQGLDALGRLRLFSDRSVLHLYQSAYAADFLRRSGVTSGLPLFDYTDPAFTAATPAAPNEDVAIAYNPAKGGELADAFFAAAPELLARPVRGMGKTQIVELLGRTRVYVDFGHLPGKDRLPREAAAGGAVVFLRNRGAGAFHEDFPVADTFRFDEQDIASGDLARRVGAVLADPGPAFAAQDELRARIRGEREELAGQLLALRGRRRAA